MRFIPEEERKNLFLVMAGAALCFALVWGGMTFKGLLTSVGVESDPLENGSKHAQPASVSHPFGEALKLIVAAAIGTLVTAVHKRFHRDKPMARSMEQAQILLCVSGALMMIIIGNSAARAFGIAGAARIISFRTPVEDPKDVTILFLLIGLGMSCGLGAIAVAGLGAALLCIFLFILDHIGETKPRSMVLSLASESGEFPTTHVQNLFLAYGIAFEPREVSKSSVKYLVTLAPDVSLEYLSDQLLSGGFSGIKSVTWEAPKKST
jgi:uncharacterized protein DUF4956